MPEIPPITFQIALPRSGRGKKELLTLRARRAEQFKKAITKLKKHPTDFTKQGIEKLNNNQLGTYSIRVSSGDRIFYDVDLKKKVVFLLRAGPHNLYRLG